MIQALRSTGARATALLLAAAAAAPATALTLAQVPIFLAPPLNPNILVVLDNSQSMDATMAGKIIAGTDPGTRGNVARAALRDILAAYRHNFNWGLGSFGLYPVAVPLVFSNAYYLGNAQTMVYTDVCNGIVDGVGVSDKTGLHAVVTDGVKTDVNGPLPCIGIPQPNGTGKKYLTFSRSGDDADVNDVYYTNDSHTTFYGVGAASGPNYYLVQTRKGTSATSWNYVAGNPANDPTNDFTLCVSDGLTVCSAPLPLGRTDAGWLPTAEEFPRMVFVPRSKGFDQPITGLGRINEAVMKSQTTTAAEVTAEEAHYNRLTALLAAEELTTTATMLRNAAEHTPLAGSLQTARSYFTGSGYTSPISQTCQANYVVLATDGNPTGDKNGDAYASADTVNTLNADGSYTFGRAVTDVLAETDLLRSATYNGHVYDIKTYVIGLGNTLVNPGSIASLNEMARRGGTGAAYLANSGSALTTAFQSIVAKIDSANNAASSVALSSGSYQAGARIYQAKFNATTWTGDLLALNISDQGVIDTAAPVWQASTQLRAQDWNSGRAILTYKPSSGRGIAFRAAADPAAPTAVELDKAQSDLLDTNPLTGSADGAGAARLAYLRGDTSREARNTASAPRFRDRLLAAVGATSDVLGDIVDSIPLYVGAPSESFRTNAYPTFARTYASRTPYLYVGANDGMLHAFNAATGVEKFAYVPNLVFSSLNGLTAPDPSFIHRFTVDGSPAVTDVYYAGSWHSLLVSGLRAGGRGLFALDVTNPDAITEAQAGSVVRWEFTDAALGHVYAKPLMRKTNGGRWSVIVGNGYNAAGGGGTAQLLVIDAETGALIRRLDTGVGSSGSPNGLSAPAAFDVDDDDAVDVVYAGDLNGNLWKFDLSNADPAQWKVGVGSANAPLFAAGSAKPITSAPDVTRHVRGGLMVAFATGRYLDTADASDTAPQTAYGIWDNNTDAPVTAGQLQPQMIVSNTATVDGTTFRFSTHRVGTPVDDALAEDSGVYSTTRGNFLASKRGWYLDLPASGERVVADTAIRSGRAVFTSIIPATDPCSSGGTGWVTEVDVFTGNRSDATTFDTNRNGVINAGDLLPPADGSSLRNNASGRALDAIPAASAVMTFNGAASSLARGIVNTSKGKLDTVGEAVDPGNQKRVMWRVVE